MDKPLSDDYFMQKKHSVHMNSFQLEQEMICLLKEQEARSPQIDLTLPDCSDYAALGYKVSSILIGSLNVSDSGYCQCVDFWECSSEGNILDNPFDYHGGEGLIDARIYFPPGNGNGRNVTTDPLLKACPEQSQVKHRIVSSLCTMLS